MTDAVHPVEVVTGTNIELPPPKLRLYSIKTVAKMFGISEFTIYRLMRDGELNPVRIGRRTLFTGTELARYIDAHSTGK